MENLTEVSQTGQTPQSQVNKLSEKKAPLEIWIDGEWEPIATKTKRCTKCGEVKVLVDFAKSKRMKNGRDSWCKVCSNRATKTWQHANPGFNKHYEWKKKHPGYSRRKRAEYQRKWQEFLGKENLRCQTCGYAACPDALEFHHINPQNKLFAIGDYMHRYACNIQHQRTLIEEVWKCTLLCANCHRELHWAEWCDSELYEQLVSHLNSFKDTEEIELCQRSCP